MKRATLLAMAIIALAFVGYYAVGFLQGDSLRQPRFTPAPGSPIPVGPMAGEPAVGDCNDDGNLDIILACGTCCGSRPSPDSGHVMVLLGDGRGQFRRANGSPIPIASSARKVALGDVNRDGKLDIVVAQHDSYEVVVLMGDGRGGFKPAAGPLVLAGKGNRPHTHDITTGDVNADGNLDILTTNANDNNISILLGDGTGRFAPAQGSPVPAGRHPYDVVALHDLNGDGKLDLVTPNLRGNAAMVLLGDGKGGFNPTKGAPFPLGPRPGYVAVGDLNRDGKPDLVATHDDDPLVAVLLGDGQGGFQPAPGSPIKTANTVWGTAIGDVNADGLNDLVMGANTQHGVTVLLGDGQGGFKPASGSPFSAGDMPGYVALADLNKDGKPDIVTGNYQSGDVTVLLNTSR